MVMPLISASSQYSNLMELLRASDSSCVAVTVLLSSMPLPFTVTPSASLPISEPYTTEPFSR